ncbi:FtsX-like permease family protein [Aliivibrio fischeri]|uniref:ABC transporter permease n=1 Tax=Aliivibrio fischeri TaxID=668 RepID=UPI0012D8C332|nr:FtsX-like permease family protein [Aliivibrio fischeri]MUK61879.1 FtsX-like permease family protein [Aliivibrio fischeri]MUL21850.1 FtsX-like permease family protein [Aliivibrio fischeri]MUL25935.1 FtsX-like permease family protein [Aliivibrio fischeri]
MNEKSLTSISSDNSPSSGSRMILRWSWREIWQGQLWPVMAALTLIVACVVALSALAIRVEKVMTDQGRSMMAADLVFRSANPTPGSILQRADEHDLVISSQVRFQTMAFSDTGMQLVSVKSVESNYPLRGELLLHGANNEQYTQVNQGEVWVADRLLSLLELNIGDVIAIGDAELPISGVIESEPELAFNPFRTMPSVFIHQSDLDKTGAIQLGSRVQYRTLFKGDDNAISLLQSEYELQPGESWISEETQGRTADLMQKAKQYLSLTILMVILMASVTLVLTCQHYATSRANTVAMLKSMGASKAWLKRWLFSQVGLMFVTGVIVGSLIGLGLELLLRIPLTDILPEDLPSYGWQPFLFGSIVALFIGLPALGIPLIRLLDTPAITVLQSQINTSSKKGWWLIAVPIIAFLFMYGNNSLVWMVSVGLVILFILLAGISYGLVHLFGQIKWGAAMTLALSRIKRSPKNSMMQLAALSGSLMLVAVIWLVRTDLLGDWQQTLPPDAPNVFAMNIAPYEQQEYLQALDNEKLDRSEGYPIVRGRLTEINGESTREKMKGEGQGSDALRREINFTWRNALPVHNQVTEGAWTSENGVSVEQDVANDLNIKIGDTLSFSVNSQPFTAVVNSIRIVDWQSMKPNFYFIFTPDVIADLPATWLVSFKVNDDENTLLNQLARDYPTVSLLDFRTMGGKIQIMLAQITWSLTVLAGLGVVSGILLIFTLLRLSLYQRQREITLYRTLGASRQRISNTLWSEYGVMALAAGFVAVMGAEAIVFSLVKWGFKLEPTLHISMWFVLPLIAMMIVFMSLVSVIKQLLKPLK